MNKMIIAAMFALVTLSGANAADSVAKTCGVQWKAYKAEHGKPKVGEGRAAWQAYYKTCREKAKTASATDANGNSVSK
jgi:hypothetical protein